jgi:hypothetical protein
MTTSLLAAALHEAEHRLVDAQEALVSAHRVATADGQRGIEDLALADAAEYVTVAVLRVRGVTDPDEVPA